MSGPNVTLGVIAPYADDVITSRAALTEFCGVLEECGVESVWTVEHVLEADAYEPRYPYSDDGRMPRRFVPMADPLELLAFFAALTTTITLGTSVVVAPLHSPVVLAKRASTLANLSGGRFDARARHRLAEGGVRVRGRPLRRPRACDSTSASAQ